MSCDEILQQLRMVTGDHVAPDSPGLQVHGAVVAFGGRSVLNGVSLSVKSGDRVLVTGGHSAGKTLLARVMTGLVQPDAGQVLFWGRDIYEKPGLMQALRACMGVVPQKEALVFGATATQNVAGFRRGITSRQAEAVLSDLGLAGHTDIPVSRLSGGMRRRVLLARAVVHRPRILVLDEPVAGLDEQTALRSLELVFSHADDTKAALVILAADPHPFDRWPMRRLRLEDGILRKYAAASGEGGAS